MSSSDTASAASETGVLSAAELLPSAQAQATRRHLSAQWTQTDMNVGASTFPPQPASSLHGIPLSSRSSQAQVVPPIASSPALSFVSQASSIAMPIRQRSSTKTIDQRLDDVERDFNSVLLPQCDKLRKTPPNNAKARSVESQKLSQHIETAVIGWLNGFPMPKDHPAQQRRRAMLSHAQQALDSLKRAQKALSIQPTSAVEPTGPSALAINVVPQISTATFPIGALPCQSPIPSTPTTQPPPYSPMPLPSVASSLNPIVFPSPEKPRAKKVIRKKAPPPPKKFVPAKAIYDFDPEVEDDEGLPVKEGDDIEVIERTSELEEDGWCRARVKGEKKIGLVPLEYIELEQKQLTATQTPTFAPQPTIDQTSISHSFSALNANSYPNLSTVPIYPPSQPEQSCPVVYLNTPQTAPNISEQSMPQDRSTGKVNIAGLGITATSTPPGVTTVNRRQSQSETSATSHSSQQTQPAINDRQSSTVDIIPESQQANVAIETQDNSGNNILVTLPQSQALNADESSPPMMDLSAFSFPPFEPQPLTFNPSPVLPKANNDAYMARPIAGTQSSIKNIDIDSRKKNAPLRGPIDYDDLGYES